MRARQRMASGLVLITISLGLSGCGGTVVTGEGSSDDVAPKRDGGDDDGIAVDPGGSIGGSSAVGPGVCGNGALDPGEACDGANLGGETCMSATMGALSAGSVHCAVNCALDVSECRRAGSGYPTTGGSHAGGVYGEGGVYGPGGYPGAGGTYGMGGYPGGAGAYGTGGYYPGAGGRYGMGGYPGGAGAYGTGGYYPGAGGFGTGAFYGGGGTFGMGGYGAYPATGGVGQDGGTTGADVYSCFARQASGVSVPLYSDPVGECGSYNAGPLMGYCIGGAVASYGIPWPADTCGSGTCVPKLKVDAPGSCFAKCESRFGSGACVPTYVAEAFSPGASSIVGQATCGSAETCVPCVNPVDGVTRTGACDE